MIQSIIEAIKGNRGLTRIQLNFLRLEVGRILGWSNVTNPTAQKLHPVHWQHWVPPGDNDRSYFTLPDFPNDLNVMSAAERKLTPAQKDFFYQNLVELASGKWNPDELAESISEDPNFEEGALAVVLKQALITAGSAPATNRAAVYILTVQTIK